MSGDSQTLLMMARDGDEIALQQLLLAYSSSLAYSVRGRIPPRLQSMVDVEDILQNTFIHVFRSFSSFRGQDIESFATWLRVIADARLADTIRTATRKKRGGDFNQVNVGDSGTSRSCLLLINVLHVESGQTPSRIVAAGEAVAALQVALAGLPDEQRNVIWLRYFEHLSAEEIADATGKTQAAVRGLLHRGKAALQESLGNTSRWFSDIQ